MNSVWQVARYRCLVLGGLVACAPTAASQRPTAPPQRSTVSGVPPGPPVAVVPQVPSPVSRRRPAPLFPPPAPAPPPVVDAEQRAILDALDVVAKALETPRAASDLAATLGTDVTTDPAQSFVEVTPRDAVLQRIRVGLNRRPAENYVEVTVRTPTSAVILGTRFGELTEAGLVPEFDDPYWLTTCRKLPDGATVSIEVMFDWVPKLEAAEPTSTVYLQRWPDGGCP